MMSSTFPAIYHPVELLATEVLLITLVVGFTSSRSILRLAALPLQVTCAYAVVTTSKLYMRSHWASLLSGCAGIFVLQYLELALLSRWAFEDDLKRKYVLGPATGAIPNGNGTKEADKAKGKKENTDSEILEKLKFGYFSAFSFRSVNTPYEVKNTPAFSKNETPDKHQFLTAQYLILLGCLFVVDLSGSLFTPSDPAARFAQQKIPLLTRAGEVTKGELISRAVSTAVWWINWYAIMQGVTSLAAVVAIECKISETKEWRPLFGSLSSAYSLRGFWSTFWPQTLRQSLTNSAFFIAHEILRLPQDSVVARRLKPLLAFAMLGLLHIVAELGGGLPLAESGSLRFFLTQVIGIVIEDAIKSNFLDQGQNRNSGPPGLLIKLLGYIWVVSFLIWSTPKWSYPETIQGDKAPFLPWSFVLWVGKYLGN